MYLLKSARCRIVLVAFAATLFAAGMLHCKSDKSEDWLLQFWVAGPPPAGFTDCISILQIIRQRGLDVSNVHRFGTDDPNVRYSARVSDLPLDTLKSYCDWEACLRTNGYAHACWVDDAGLEQCGVCDGGAGDTCDGFPMDQTACVAQAAGRANCHVGLLQDCLIQRAIRGFPDSRVTETCRLSAQACAGELPGDLTEQAHTAAHETDQVTIERVLCDVAAGAAAYPDTSAEYKSGWQQRILSGWDGGLPVDALDCAKDMLDAGVDAEDTSSDDASDASDDAPDNAEGE